MTLSQAGNEVRRKHETKSRKGNFLWQTQKCSAIDRKGTDGKEVKTKGRKEIENKAGYTAGQVACGWAGAAMK